MASDLVTVNYPTPDLPVVGAALALARQVVIDDRDTYDIADSRLVEVKASFKRINDARKTIVDPINKAKDAVQALFNPVLEDLNLAEAHIKTAMLTYTRDQRRKQADEQARLDGIARKEKERLEVAAGKAEAKGQTEKAEVLAATAAVISAPTAMASYVAPKGSITRKKWKARVTDKQKLVASILANPAFLNLIEIDAGGLNKLSDAMEGNVTLDGVECYEEETLARRVG